MANCRHVIHCFPDMRIGLFFGSFNPIHIGHLLIASYVADRGDLDELWLVVTPHNPLKERKTLADDYDRLHFVQVAVAEHPKLRASDVEFRLPQPSYTTDTLAHLREQYPGVEFVLIMGGDNLASFHKWKNYERILELHELLVYSRPKNDPGAWSRHPRVRILEDAPQIEISSTFIRERIRQGKSIRYWVPDAVLEAIEQSGTYKSMDGEW